MKKVRESDKKVAIKKKLDVKVAPEFLEMFKKSETLSSTQVILPWYL